MNSNHLLSTNKNNYFIKILVPAISGGAVIGKGGEALIKAQNGSDTKVKVSKLNEFYPGTNERVCLVQGDPAGIIKMVDYINKCIIDTKVDPNFYDRHKQTRILIPNTSAGLLIGKEGETINEIKKLSGAYIQVSPKSNNRELVERNVVISGDFDQRHNATKLIIDKLIEDPKLCYYPYVNYGETMSNSFGGQYGLGISSPAYTSMVFDSSHQYPGNRNINYYPSQPSSYFSNSRPFTSSFQQLDLMASDSIHGINRTLEVDEAFVGSIIGPKGRSIVELQEITDTNIKVSKKNTDSPDLNNKRTITINGMYENVSRAYLLINDKIQLEKAKRDVSSLETNLSES